MIREVIFDLIALVVFTTGGAFYAIILLRLLPHKFKGIKGIILDFSLGIVGGVVFIILTEIYYRTIVTPYTLFCYCLGLVGTLFLKTEKVEPTKRNNRIFHIRKRKDKSIKKGKNAKIKPRSC